MISRLVSQGWPGELFMISLGKWLLLIQIVRCRWWIEALVEATINWLVGKVVRWYFEAFYVWRDKHYKFGVNEQPCWWGDQGEDYYFIITLSPLLHNWKVPPSSVKKTSPTSPPTPPIIPTNPPCKESSESIDETLVTLKNDYIPFNSLIWRLLTSRWW